MLFQISSFSLAPPHRHSPGQPNSTPTSWFDVYFQFESVLLAEALPFAQLFLGKHVSVWFLITCSPLMNWKTRPNRDTDRQRRRRLLLVPTIHFVSFSPCEKNLPVWCGYAIPCNYENRAAPATCSNREKLSFFRLTKCCGYDNDWETIDDQH